MADDGLAREIEGLIAEMRRVADKFGEERPHLYTYEVRDWADRLAVLSRRFPQEQMEAAVCYDLPAVTAAAEGAIHWKEPHRDAPTCSACAGKGWISPADAERVVQQNGETFTAWYQHRKAHFEPEGWQPMASAPKDGTAILGFGIHTHSPTDAQRGVKAGDHWWAIIVWDVWRGDPSDGWGDSSRWVFSKDGKPAWSFPSHWRPLPAAPPGASGEQK